MGQWKGQAETESRSDDEVQSDDEDRVYTVGRGKLGSKGQGQRKGQAETESRLDDEARSNDEDRVFTVGRGKLGKSKGQMKGGETGSDEEAWPRKKAVKDPKPKMIVGTQIIGRSKKDPDSSSMTGLVRIASMFQVRMKLSRELRPAQVTPFQEES